MKLVFYKEPHDSWLQKMASRGRSTSEAFCSVPFREPQAHPPVCGACKSVGSKMCYNIVFSFLALRTLRAATDLSPGELQQNSWSGAGSDLRESCVPNGARAGAGCSKLRWPNWLWLLSRATAVVKVCYIFHVFVIEAGVHEREGDLRRAGASGLPAGSWDDLTYSQTCLGSDHSEPLHCWCNCTFCL